MIQIRSFTILLIFATSSLFANNLELALADFIREREIPRLASVYPQADISIQLENQATLNYLQACSPSNLIIENQRPGAQKRTTYSIECTAPSWKSYLPVSQEILIDAYRAITPIDRKQNISPDNTDLGKVDVTQLRGQIYTTDNPPFGLIASRNISINSFITNQMTEQPLLIKKGQQVIIRAQGGGISVHMNGESLEDGILGQQIRVKNSSSERIVYGKVVSSNEILVNY